MEPFDWVTDFAKGMAFPYDQNATGYSNVQRAAGSPMPTEVYDALLTAVIKWEDNATVEAELISEMLFILAKWRGISAIPSSQNTGAQDVVITPEMLRAGRRALHDAIGYQYNGVADEVVAAIFDEMARVSVNQ